MATATDPVTERVARPKGAYEHLATKAALAHLELRLTQGLTQMESRLTRQMAQMESRLTWRMIGAMAVMSGVIIAAAGLIVRFL